MKAINKYLIIGLCFFIIKARGNAFDNIVRMINVYKNKTELYMEFDLVLNYQNYNKP